MEHAWEYVIDGETVMEVYPNHERFNTAYLSARDDVKNSDVPEGGELRYIGTGTYTHV